MTHTDFRRTIENLGLSQAGVSRILGVSDRAVRMWIAGDRSIPEPVAKLLRLLASGALTVDQVQDA